MFQFAVSVFQMLTITLPCHVAGSTPRDISSPPASAWTMLTDQKMMDHFDHSHRIHGAGIFTYIWVIYGANVGKYSVHGAYGIVREFQKMTDFQHLGA